MSTLRCHRLRRERDAHPCRSMMTPPPAPPRLAAWLVETAGHAGAAREWNSPSRKTVISGRGGRAVADTPAAPAVYRLSRQWMRQLRRDATVLVEGVVGHRHERLPEVLHLLGNHLDLALRKRREVRAF